MKYDSFESKSSSSAKSVSKIESILLHPLFFNQTFENSYKLKFFGIFIDFSSSIDYCKQLMKSESSVFPHANFLKYNLQPLKNYSCPIVFIN